VKPGKDWKAIQISDMDGDLNSDVILQNQVSGEVYLWSLKNNDIVTSNLMGKLSPSNAWSIIDTSRNSYNHSDNSFVLHNRFTGDLVNAKLGNEAITITRQPVTATKSGNVSFGKPLMTNSMNMTPSWQGEVFFTNLTTGKMSIVRLDGTLVSDAESNLDVANPGWTPIAIVDTKI
jgi:hypothetical protein